MSKNMDGRKNKNKDLLVDESDQNQPFLNGRVPYEISESKPSRNLIITYYRE